MGRLATVGMMIFFAAAAAWAITPEEEELARLNGIFEQQLTTYADTCQTDLAAWSQGYLQALVKFQADAQAAGALEAWEACHSEQQRFREASQLDAAVVESSPKVLQQMQQHYLAQRDAIDLHRHTQVIDLWHSYTQKLDMYKRTWTQAGKIEAAKEAKQAIEAAATHPEVTASQFALDTLAAETPEPAPEPMAPTAVAPPAPAPEPEAAAVANVFFPPRFEPIDADGETVSLKIGERLWSSLGCAVNKGTSFTLTFMQWGRLTVPDGLSLRVGQGAWIDVEKSTLVVTADATGEIFVRSTKPHRRLEVTARGQLYRRKRLPKQKMRKWPARN